MTINHTGLENNTNTQYFTVAGHAFMVRTPDDVDIYNLIPSLRAFAETGTENSKQLFSLTFSEHVPRYAQKILLTHFEWDDAECSIYTLDGGYELQINPKKEHTCFRMLLKQDFTRATAEIKTDSPTAPLVANNFLMMLYAFATAPYHTLMFHASVVCNQDNGVLFLGKSGTGKSTHTRLWLEYIGGSELLNDDNPIVRVHPDGEAWVYGSPWSGKTPCYRNEAVRIKAFVRLKQATENQIKRQKTVDAFASLLPSCSCLRQEEHLFDAVCDTVGLLAATTPVYELECLPDAGAAKLCYSMTVQQ